MAIMVQTLTPDDIAIADAIAVAAFHAPNSRAPEIRRYLRLQPDGWFLARRDGLPAGMGGAVDYGPFAYIGLMATDPAQQRQGIGQAVMERILAFLLARRCPLALLDASPFGAPLYARLGFVTTEHSDVWTCATRPTTLHAPHSNVFSLSEVDLPELAAFDTPQFGADRARVLAAFLAEFPDRVFGFRDAQGKLAGFCVAQPRTLGPWVASTPDAAQALLAHALPLYAAPPQILIPASNLSGPTILEAAGYTRQRTLQHMRLGDGPSRDRQQTYGLASFALG